MSRRRTNSVNPQPPAARPPLVPHLPRPSKAFLATTIVLLVLWVAMLVIMAAAG